MVSVLAFYSDDSSLNPAEVYVFSVKLWLKRTKIKRGRGWPAFKKYGNIVKRHSLFLAQISGGLDRDSQISSEELSRRNKKSLQQSRLDQSHALPGTDLLKMKHCT